MKDELRPAGVEKDFAGSCPKGVRTILSGMETRPTGVRTKPKFHFGTPNTVGYGNPTYKHRPIETYFLLVIKACLLLFSMSCRNSNQAGDSYNDTYKE
jgi:hypothetical protein